MNDERLSIRGELQTTPEDVDPESMAGRALDPSYSAGQAVSAYTELRSRPSGLACAMALKAQMKRCRDNNLPEEMLLAQAHTLNAIFNSLSVRAEENPGEYGEERESCLRLAYKAQSQCRETIESLTAMRRYPMDTNNNDGLIDEVLTVVRAVRKLRARGDALYVSYLAVAVSLGWTDMRVRRKVAIAIRRGWLVKKQVGLRKPADLYIGTAPSLA